MLGKQRADLTSNKLSGEKLLNWTGRTFSHMMLRYSLSVEDAICVHIWWVLFLTLKHSKVVEESVVRIQTFFLVSFNFVALNRIGSQTNAKEFICVIPDEDVSCLGSFQTARVMPASPHKRGPALTNYY